MNNEKEKCENCGKPTRRRFRVHDPRVRTYYRNRQRLEGPPVQTLCSAACARDTMRESSRRLPNGWRVEEVKA